MVDRDPIEEWLRQRESGSPHDARGILDALEAAFRARLSARGQRLDDEHLAAANQLAERELARFAGRTKAEFLDWFESLSSIASPGAGALADETLRTNPIEDDTTLAKPLPSQVPFAVGASLGRVNDVLGWRIDGGWTLARIAQELRCTNSQAAAMVRIAAQRQADKCDASMECELPLDHELAGILQQLDGGKTLDREATAKNHADGETLLEILDQLETLSEATASDQQTLILDSTASAKARKSSTKMPRGQPFGDYELLHVIAKGGMGVVHKARQRKLNRIVAIKTILAGQFADSDDVERFYAEAESAANLRHPNIVSIYEIGEHDGQHFFSMEYIEGDSLADLVRENALLPRKAAEYARTIALAMQYAHDQGILHRDLKPSNILVDADNVPLITDFGLAKQVDGQSQLTMSGAVIGTPSYMPPEQASGQIDRVDTRSDTYSLGAILFELLTGSPPFRSSSPFETIRQVIEEQAVSPRLLNTSVPADLETICLKCLQKEQAKRYQSAGELADEIERFLNGEPILARPVGRLERTWRWCRRYPKMAAMIGATALAFLATFATITVAYFETTAALAGEKVARADAEASYQQARQAVDEFFTTVAEDTLLNRYGMQPVRKELLEKALNYYERFLRQRRNDPTIADEVAMTLYRVGFISDQMGSRDEAMRSLEQAREMQEALVAKTPTDTKRLHALSDTLVDIARIQLSGDQDAETLQRRVIQLRQSMVNQDSDNSEFARELANGHMNLGILFRERAKRSHGKAAEALRGDDQNTADRLTKEGDQHHDKAIKEYQTAQAIRKEAIERAGADNRKLRINYGMGYFNLGQSAADVLDVETAEANYQKAIKVFELLRDPSNPDFATELNLATCYRVLADHYSKHGDHDKATKNYTAAEAILTPLALRNPDELNFQRALADTYKNRGQAFFEHDQLDEAIDRISKALVIEQGLAERNPELPRDRRAFHDTSYAFAQYQLEMNGNEAAINALNSLKDFYVKAIRGPLTEHPDQLPDATASLAEVAIAIGETYISMDELDKALTNYELAIGLFQPIVESAPTVSQTHVDYLTTLLQACQVAGELNRPQASDDMLERADKLLELLRADHADDDWFKELDELARSLQAGSSS